MSEKEKPAKTDSATDTPHGVDKVAPEESTEKPRFRLNYRKAGCCSRMFYMFAQPLIDSIKANDSKMTEEMIESMCEHDDETEEYLKQFMNNLERRKKKYDLENANKIQKDDFYYVVRGTIWDTFSAELIASGMFSFLGESCAIGYTMFLVVLISFLQDDEIEWYWGAIYVVIFGGMMLTGGICRNMWVFKGALTSVRMRKTLISALYTKVSKLSMKSVTETNSGKLITIASGDILAIEYAMGIVSILFAAPLVNVVAFIVLGFTSGWEYAGVTFGIWIIIIILQHWCSEKCKELRLKESAVNDERQKLVNDMVVGARTIKSYGWEKHYINKVKI